MTSISLRRRWGFSPTRTCVVASSVQRGRCSFRAARSRKNRPSIRSSPKATIAEREKSRTKPAWAASTGRRTRRKNRPPASRSCITTTTARRQTTTKTRRRLARSPSREAWAGAATGWKTTSITGDHRRVSREAARPKPWTCEIATPRTAGAARSCRRARRAAVSPASLRGARRDPLRFICPRR